MNGNGVWKWIAAILATVILAGAPGVVEIIRAPSQSDVKEIRAQQLDLLVRVTRLETEVLQLQKQLETHVGQS